MNKTDNNHIFQVSVRNANMTDLTAILNIEQLGFTAAEAGTELQYIERLQKLKETFLVAVINNKVVGFVVGPVVQEDKIVDWMYEEIHGQDIVGGNQMVLTIAVDPTFQGYHIGTQLLDAFYNKAKTHNRKTIALTCLEKNIPFYEKNGYKNVGFGIAGPILESDTTNVENMISLDVSSLVTLSLWFAKKYKTIEGKQLLNVSSTAGYEINTRAVLYSASKNFVASFTEGLAIELKNNHYPLQAKVLAPYATETNFAKTSLGIESFSYQQNYQNYHTAQQMSEFIVQLLESNQIVGRVNAKNMKFELTDTLLTWFA